MARVVDLERRRVEQLAEELLPVLRGSGRLGALTSELEDVERWRRAARRAGRLLGWRVRTGATADGERVWAVSEDYVPPATEVEDAMRRLNELLGGGPPTPAAGVAGRYFERCWEIRAVSFAPASSSIDGTTCW